MKAAVLVEQKKPLVIADISMPAKLEYGQVLVKLFYSGICGAQINEIEGTKGEDKFLPHLLGHEGSGEVMRIGSGVTKVKAGDKVVLHWKTGAGIQSAAPVYDWEGKRVNAGWVTTFNEYAVVSENRITPISHGTDLITATLYGCALTTAFGVVSHDARLKSGESLIVFGAGGVGSAIITAGFITGAYPIITVDINEFKLRKAKELGADYVLKFSDTNTLRNRIKEYTGNLGCDVVVDTTGIKKVRELSYDLTNSTGRTILVGVPKKGEKMCIDSFPLHFDKKITGSFGGDTNPSYDIPRLIRLLKGRNIKLNKLISKIFPLEKINEAIKLVRHGNVIRCVIKFNSHSE